MEDLRNEVLNISSTRNGDTGCFLHFVYWLTCFGCNRQKKPSMFSVLILILIKKAGSCCLFVNRALVNFRNINCIVIGWTSVVIGGLRFSKWCNICFHIDVSPCMFEVLVLVYSCIDFYSLMLGPLFLISFALSIALSNFILKNQLVITCIGWSWL